MFRNFYTFVTFNIKQRCKSKHNYQICKKNLTKLSNKIHKEMISRLLKKAFLTFQNMEKVEYQVQIAMRFSQIRKNLYNDDNRKMAFAIGEDENILSAICRGKRAPGLTTILKLVNANKEVDANWLLVGRLPRVPKVDPKPYESTVESSSVASEDSEPLSSPLPSVLLDRYDAAQQEIGSLRDRLAAAAETIAKLTSQLSDIRKKTPSLSDTTAMEPILV